MNSSSPIIVSLCCNSPENGHFLGYLTGLEIQESQLSCGWENESPELLFDGQYMLVERQKYYCIERRRWVARGYWDAVLMPAEAVARLLNWARDNGFFWESAPSDFAEVWDSGEKIVESHLEMLF